MRTAYEKGYRVFTLTDCTAATSAEEQAAAHRRAERGRKAVSSLIGGEEGGRERGEGPIHIRFEGACTPPSFPLNP